MNKTKHYVAMDYTTKSHPRTMKEAFGPYTDNNLQPLGKPQPMDWQDKVVIAGCIIVAVMFAALALGAV